MPYAPRYTNLVTLFQQSCDKFGDAPLFGTRKPDGWHWTTYGAVRSSWSTTRAPGSPRSACSAAIASR